MNYKHVPIMKRTLRCDEGYELFLPDEGVEVTQTTLSCVEGEIYDPPEIPECFESKSTR